eukprot:311354-Alexandrium_andersonii.AAC.1
MKAPTRMFLGNRGLANVVYLLEQQFGTEDLDMTRSALGKWEQFHRKNIRAWRTSWTTSTSSSLASPTTASTSATSA